MSLGCAGNDQHTALLPEKPFAKGRAAQTSVGPFLPAAATLNETPGT